MKFNAPSYSAIRNCTSEEQVEALEVAGGSTKSRLFENAPFVILPPLELKAFVQAESRKAFNLLEVEKNYAFCQAIWWLTVWRVAPVPVDASSGLLCTHAYYPDANTIKSLNINTTAPGLLMKYRCIYCPMDSHHGWLAFLCGALLAWIIGRKVIWTQASEKFD